MTSAQVNAAIAVAIERFAERVATELERRSDQGNGVASFCLSETADVVREMGKAKRRRPPR